MTDENTTTGFAAYDTDHLRFVSGVHATKGEAAKEAKAANVANFELREV